MKADLYTKIVLTVIAIALVANFFKGTDIVTTAQAQTILSAPTVAEQPKTIDVNIVSLNGIPLLNRKIKLANGEIRNLLPISIENTDEPVDVNISKPIEATLKYDNSIDVWVKNFP